MRVAFYTLGCKVNHYETQAMEELFLAAGNEVVPFLSQADIYIINTCTVTQMSDKKSRQMLSRAHKLNPEALVVAVGCYVQTAGNDIAGMEGVGLLVGTQGKKDIVRLCEQALEGRKSENIGLNRDFEELSATHDSRTRATLKIQDGCNRYCSYCIIPYARGPLRSRSFEGCAEQIKKLVDAGYKEIVLTGIQLCAYSDGEKDLCDVIQLCDTIGVMRLRLGSIEPAFVTPKFVQTCAKSRCLCQQFHLSMQSGSDTVLKRMNRRYSTSDYRQAVNALRLAMPNCAITTDVIAGFVGETEQEHRDTAKFIEEIAFARIHVFPYSVRKNTKAAAMEGHLPKAVKEERARELIALGKRLEHAFVMVQKDTIQEVLMEEDGTGYTRNYVRVRCQGEEGEAIMVKITGQEGEIALAERI